MLKKISQTQHFLPLSLSNGFCKFLYCIVWFCFSSWVNKNFSYMWDTPGLFFFAPPQTSEVNKNIFSLYRVDLLAIYCPLVAKVRNCNSMLQFDNPHQLFLRAVLYFLPFFCVMLVWVPISAYFLLQNSKCFVTFLCLGLSVDLIVLPRADCAGVCPKVRRREK